MNYIVYKTTNKVNGKIYIGIHRTDLNRKQSYIGCGVSRRDQKKSKKSGFPAAVHKYGYDNFQREVLFIYPDTDKGLKMALDKESELVTEDFVKRSDTYNLVPGGRANMGFALRKPIIQYSLQGKPIKVWDSITIAAQELNIKGINSALHNRSKYSGEYQWGFYEDNPTLKDILPTKISKKSVYQFDLQGNLIKCHKSISDASLQFSKQNSARVAISQVCNGSRVQALGYYWSFKPKFNPRKNNHLSSVAKYTDEGFFVESYSSIKEAAEDNDIKTPANIIAAIKGQQKRCGGFRWRYFYGNTSNIKPL